ncbi:hypothetical protein EXIGLDRAFT_783809 [Exidia glandulosa HHB12029]|uniref:Uncharacterized protein n=1 Tax=Exidia glandulosa HHB12029 TaxID=1314781 RepID=A0A166MVH8_EXIGL|nr:hypothetical protein EXIGLDRAFT_783809 [Exidia glandulosa HHB12029]
MAWGKRNLDHEFYEEVAFRVPALSSSGSPSSEYTAKFLRVGDIQYFTELVREENNLVLAAVNSAINRYAAPRWSPTWSLGSSIIVGQTGVGKSMCLRLALVERLLDGQQTIYLDEVAHVFAVYTTSGCRLFRTVDPSGTLQHSSPLIQTHAADILRSDCFTTAALIDSDPARPQPPLWVVSLGDVWVNVQASSTPPLDYAINSEWAHETRADTIWMDVWSWPEVYAACVHLYGFDSERLERVCEVFFSATPTLEHCVEFSESPTTVKLLRRNVHLSAKAFVSTPNGLFLTRKLLRTYKEPEEISTSDWASVNRHAAHCTWLYAVLDPNSHDDHRGRATSTVTTRDVRPYII